MICKRTLIGGLIYSVPLLVDTLLGKQTLFIKQFSTVQSIFATKKSPTRKKSS
jgi:hypothetical protein